MALTCGWILVQDLIYLVRTMHDLFTTMLLLQHFKEYNSVFEWLVRVGNVLTQNTKLLKRCIDRYVVIVILKVIVKK